MPEPESLMEGSAGDIEGLLEIMRRLRDPETGCPWDVRQDFASIAPYTIEEAYEVADAIRNGDLDGLRHELGDLLLQVVYHARMAEEAGRFGFADVVAAISEKMVRRHPHVFGGTAGKEGFNSADWERQKHQEEEDGVRSLLDGAAGPDAPLARALTLGLRAKRAGFDWPDPEAVFAKVEEELAELREADSTARRREELGDLLFTLANLARHLDIDPEASLRAANGKFETRFREIERRLAAEGRTPMESDPEELERLWAAVKEAEQI